MKKSLATFALLSTVIATSAMAKDSKNISKTVDINEGQQISIKVPVGSLKIETCDCNKIELEIKVEESEGSWSLFSSSSIEDAQLDVKNRHNRVTFEVDEDHSKQTWTVRLPAASALNIEMGVGEVHINDFNNDLNAEVGVGDIEVDINNDNYQAIKLESGVGSTSIAGMSGDVDTERSIVSSSTSYHGNGKYAMDIDVGVGAADVRM